MKIQTYYTMRFKIKEKQKPKSGDERTITLFALFPKVIDNSFIWLEKYTVKQKYICDQSDASWRWINTELCK